MTTQNFKLRGDQIELSALLKATGLCESGGEAKAAIQTGTVLVDGEVETRRSKKIRAGQNVSLGENTIVVESEK